MDHPVKAIDVTKKRSGLGRCRHFFWLGVVFDMVGVAVLFIGLFGDLIFYDMLLYLGSIIIFLSLLWWVSWYTGNIELSPGEAAPAPPHVRASTMAHALRQSLSHRFSLTIQSVSNNFVRIHRRRSRRVFQGMATLTPTVSSQVEEKLQKENKTKEETTSVRETGDPQGFCKGNLGLRPEDDTSTEAAGYPRADSDALWLGQGLSIPMVQPVSSLDKSLPSITQTSESLPVGPLASTTQSLASSASRTQPAVPEASQSHPLSAELSQNHSVEQVASQSHPLVPVTSQSYLKFLVAAESHSVVPLASQSSFLVPMAAGNHLEDLVPSQNHPVLPGTLQSQVQNLPLASQTQPSTVQDSETQAQGTKGPMMQPFKTVDSQIVQSAQDFQAMLQTQQSSSLVQESSLTHSSGSLEGSKNPVAQDFEIPSLRGQKLPKELPDTTSTVPEAATPATEAQQSLSTKSAPFSETAKKIHPL